MKRFTFILGVFVIMLAAGAQPAQAQDEQEDTWRISGYVFGDYYWMAQNHRDDLANNNGLWFRRMYLTFDRDLSESLTTRARLEANSPGNFSSSGKVTPFFKDLYVRWRKNDHDVYIGISPSPTWNVIEGFWGYRSVEKTALDLYKFGSSRDTGISFRGALDAQRKVRYHLMLGNGAGPGTETNQGKKLMASAAFYPSKSFMFEFYTDYEGRPNDTNRDTYQAFAGFTGGWGRLGLQAVRQRRHLPGTETLDLDVASVFGVFKASPKLNVLLRYDRMFDPNPDGAQIAYLPFESTARSSFVLAGLDIVVNDSLNLIPNVEWVYYDRPTPGAPRPGSDVVPRLTFFYRF